MNVAGMMSDPGRRNCLVIVMDHKVLFSAHNTCAPLECIGM